MKTILRKTTKKMMAAVMVLSAIAIGFTSCSKDKNENGYKVRMTDSPGNYTAMQLEITKVEAYLEDNGWVTLDNSTKTINVLSLTNGNEIEIAQKTDLSVGNYTKIRLSYGTNNSITTETNGISGTFNLTMTGSTVIETRQEVNSSAGADVLLDFNVAKSIKENAGSFICEPFITEIKDEETGLKGEVEGSIHSAIIASDGTNEYSTYTDAQGRFLMRGMEPGNYNVDFFAKDSSSTSATTTIENVAIVKGKTTNVGTVSYN